MGASMEERTGLELVFSAQKGDKNAFGLLVQRYQKLVFNFTRKLVSDEDIAQELAQEAFLQAYLSLDRLRDPMRFKSWLCSIVANVCRSYLRDQKEFFFSFEAMAGGRQFDSVLFSGSNISPEKLAEESELHQIILGAISSLTPIDRDIMLQFYYDQLSLKEIALLQDISVSAARVRLHRARQRLKIILISEYPEIIPHEDGRKNMIRVTVFDVVKQDQTISKGGSNINYVMILQDETSRRVLPIWIGPFEGQSIAGILVGFSTLRPMTFNFIANLLKAIKAQIEEVRINDLRDNTFYATVRIRCGQTVNEIDARPSDALALAALIDSPVFVSEDIMARAGVDIPQGTQSSPGEKGVDKILKEIKEMQSQAAKSISMPREEIVKSRDELLAAVFETYKDSLANK